MFIKINNIHVWIPRSDVSHHILHILHIPLRDLRGNLHDDLHDDLHDGPRGIHRGVLHNAHDDHSRHGEPESESGTGGGQHRGSEPRHGSCGEQRCGGCSSWCGGGCVLDKHTSNLNIPYIPLCVALLYVFLLLHICMMTLITPTAYIPL